MKAFLNDPGIKETYLKRLRLHREADQLIKGTYWENGKGCAIGCTVHSSRHDAYEIELGIPLILARLEDGIFEGLPNGKALAWPERFLSAIKVGADLSQVGNKFLHWLLVDPTDGVVKYANSEKSRKAVQAVGDLYQRKLNGEMVTREDWKAAADAAYADGDADAYAAYAAAAYAAAAYAAYAADAAAARRSQSRIRQSAKLIELLEACV